MGYRDGQTISRAGWLVLVTLAGCLAAIALPGWVRSTMNADEARAIADTREVMAGEEAYAAANMGYYGPLYHLCNGPECVIGIPSYPADGPDFLSPDLGRVSPYLKDGYIREWILDGIPTSVPPAGDPLSALNYCYSSVSEFPTIPESRSFLGNGDGLLFSDIGVEIPCPVPPGHHRLIELPDELAGDFGTQGLWHYDGLGTWQKLSSWDPSQVIAWQRSLVGAFGPDRGIWLYDGQWVKLSNWTPTLIGSWGDRLVAAFDAGRGLWVYDGSVWERISKWEPQELFAWGHVLVASFSSGRGSWAFWPPRGWMKIASSEAYLIDSASSFLYAAFRGYGLYRLETYRQGFESEGWDWERRSPWEPEQITSFPYGLSSEPLAGDFGDPRGLWQDSSNWSKVSTWDPLILASDERRLYAAFVAGQGLWAYDDAGWERLSGWEARNIEATTDYLGVTFDAGVYRHDATGWTRLSTWSAETLTAVDLIE